MTKGFGLIGILIGIAIIGVIAGGGFYYSNTTTQTIDDNDGIEDIINKAEDVKDKLEESNENISDNLTETNDLPSKILATVDNWKTYRNEEYGFEIQHPSYYVVTSGNVYSGRDYIIAQNESDNSEDPGKDFNIYIDIYKSETDWIVKWESTSKEENWKGHGEAYNQFLGTTTFMNTTVGLTNWCDMGGCSKMMAIPRNNLLYQLEIASDWDTYYGKENEEQNIKIRSQILSTFKFTNEITDDLGSGYTKNKNNVYYEDTVVKNADPNTFKILDVCGGAERSGASYAIDNRAVYVGSEIVESADPNTFKIIASFETEEGMYAWSTYAKDIDTIFSGCGNVIDNADIDTFEYISEGYAKDKNNVYDWGTILEEVIPSQCTLENIDGCKDD